MGSYEPNPASLTDFPNSDAQLEIEGTRDPQSPARLEPIGWFHGSLERPPRIKGPSFVTPTLPDINGNPSYDSSLTLPPPKKSKFCMGTSAFSRRNEEMATPSCSSKLLSCRCYVLIINARFFVLKLYRFEINFYGDGGRTSSRGAIRPFGWCWVRFQLWGRTVH